MGRKRAQLDVTVKLLLDSGELEAGRDVLQVASRTETRYGDLHADGGIFFEGIKHRSLSSFAVAAIRSCGAMSRKTANGWQAVSYRGKPLDQYRSQFLEKRCQLSESTNREVDLSTDTKKRKVINGSFKQTDLSRDNSSVSGCSRCSFSDISPLPRNKDLTSYGRRRLRPSRSWFDTASVTENKSISPSPPIDAACGMKVITPEKEMEEEEEEEEEHGRQNLLVNMWLKKALSKRHREECGMS